MTPAAGGAATGRALGPSAAAVRLGACLGAPPVGTGRRSRRRSAPSGKAPVQALGAGAGRRPAGGPPQAGSLLGSWPAQRSLRPFACVRSGAATHSRWLLVLRLCSWQFLQS